MINEAKNELSFLIKKFNMNKEFYCSQGCNEATIRLEFIDEFFKILGWDVSNERCLSSKNKDVQVEKRINDNNNIADYVLYENQQPKFILEAKAARINLEDQSLWIKLIKEAKYIGCHFAILTNFKYIYFFDTAFYENNLKNCLLFKLNYKDYIKDFDKLLFLYKRYQSHDQPKRLITNVAIEQNALFGILASFCTVQTFLTQVGLFEFKMNIPIELENKVLKHYFLSFQNSFYYKIDNIFSFKQDKDFLNIYSDAISQLENKITLTNTMLFLNTKKYQKQINKYIQNNSDKLILKYQELILYFDKRFDDNRVTSLSSIAVGFYILQETNIFKKNYNSFLEKLEILYLNCHDNNQINKLIKFIVKNKSIYVNTAMIPRNRIGGIRKSKEALSLLEKAEQLEIGILINKKLTINDKFKRNNY